jgi:hypothetical protein
MVGYLFALVQFTFGDGMLIGFSSFEVANGFPYRPIYTHTYQTFAASEYNIAFGILPGIIFVSL